MRNLPGLHRWSSVRALDKLGHTGLEARPVRLRGPESRLATALDQLCEGVPLNWGQMEDDPELITLARLQVAGEQCKEELIEVPPNLRATIIERLAPRLPEPKPQPVKEVPKSLAGFSENVQVLTQVEDDIRLTSDMPLWIAATVLASAVAVLALWLISVVFHF
jgi:hypothetical protein